MPLVLILSFLFGALLGAISMVVMFMQDDSGWRNLTAFLFVLMLATISFILAVI